jgi:hypothetical protein
MKFYSHSRPLFPDVDEADDKNEQEYPHFQRLKSLTAKEISPRVRKTTSISKMRKSISTRK